MLALTGTRLSYVGIIWQVLCCEELAAAMGLTRWTRKSFLRSPETYLILLKKVSLSYLMINYGLRLYTQQTVSLLRRIYDNGSSL